MRYKLDLRIANLEATDVPMLNAYSANTCQSVSCPLPVQSLTQNQIESEATEDTIKFFSQMEVVDFSCGITRLQCFQHCQNSINMEYDNCAFVAALKNAKTTIVDDPFEGRFCENREHQSICLVFKNIRQQPPNFAVTIESLWSVGSFPCMQHTKETRRFVRRKCFVSEACNAYATNKNLACLLDTTGSSSSNEIRSFTHVYYQAKYNLQATHSIKLHRQFCLALRQACICC